MKTKHFVIAGTTLILILGIGFGYLPVKKAVRMDGLDKSRYYIIVKVQKSTISPWIAVGDSYGSYEDSRNVYITGIEPNGYDYPIDFGHNTFVCYGQYTGTRDVGAGEHLTFDSESWDILYPVMRNGGILDSVLPKSYICRYDII